MGIKMLFNGDNSSISANYVSSQLLNMQPLGNHIIISLPLTVQPPNIPEMGGTQYTTGVNFHVHMYVRPGHIGFTQ